MAFRSFGMDSGYRLELYPLRSVDLSLFRSQHSLDNRTCVAMDVSDSLQHEDRHPAQPDSQAGTLYELRDPLLGDDPPSDGGASVCGARSMRALRNDR